VAGAVRITRVRTPADVRRMRELRNVVFVLEQHVPLAEEFDAADTSPTTVHVLAWDADADAAHGEVLGTGRLLTDPAHPGEVHIGRMAVSREARGRGVGAALVRALETIALAEFAVERFEARSVRIELSAQEHALGFYSRLGYVIGGPRYLDAGIWHRDAVRVLAEPAREST
jgi:predicted GNAT family N-acyltransferase